MFTFLPHVHFVAQDCDAMVGEPEQDLDRPGMGEMDIQTTSRTGVVQWSLA